MEGSKTKKHKKVSKRKEMSEGVHENCERQKTKGQRFTDCQRRGWVTFPALK